MVRSGSACRGLSDWWTPGWTPIVSVFRGGADRISASPFESVVPEPGFEPGPSYEDGILRPEKRGDESTFC